MVKFLLQRILAFLARVVGAGVIVLLLLELSYCVFGGSDQHIWQAESYEGEASVIAYDATGWRGLVSERVVSSAKVWLIAYGGVLLVGYSWGILAARLRRVKLGALLALPFSLFACVPGFWFVVAVAIYSYFAWQRPGFADEVVVQSGPDLMSWWYASIVALPVLAPAAAWQLRAVSSVIEKEAGRPFVKGLYTAGHRDDTIFYGNVYRQARPAVVGLLDQALPFILGGLVVVEWAFRYDGLGSLFVDCVKGGYYTGILMCSLVVAVVIGLVTFGRELLVKLTSVE